MNELQKITIVKIEGLANELGTTFHIKSSPSGSSQFVMGTFLDFTIWINPDGQTDFTSDFLDRRFEAEDFRNHELLLEELIATMKDAIQNREFYKKNPKKWSRPLFNRLYDKITNFLK